MPLTFAFKVAARAAEIAANPLDRAFALAIARFTGGKYSHVECWFAGPITAASCYSAREPHGTAIETIDLTDATLWELVNFPTTPVGDVLVKGFCLGSCGRPYDAAGILGIGSDLNIHIPWDRFCSEADFEVLHTLFGFCPTIEARKVAPSGRPPGGCGFYELLAERQSPPAA